MRKLDWVIIIIILETCGVENRAVSLPPPPKNRKNIFFFFAKGRQSCSCEPCKICTFKSENYIDGGGKKKKKSSCCKIIVFSFFYFFLLYYLSNFSIYFNRK